ncbi:MAG: adaptor protein MecA [Oscillospiraceae bacterium]|nr:adaptor protein MecA [Oscillospiraceae bacterium]
MQIDVLSQNTLKLTLSRLDMFDMDIKYESLSGKNPDTKRLLSHVLRTVRLDKSAGVDFSGERLFVEAFPRPDGGCMLYISCLLDENERFHSFVPADRKPVKLTAKSSSAKQSQTAKTSITPTTQKHRLLCKVAGVTDLAGVCRGLSRHMTLNKTGKTDFSSDLFVNPSDKNEYRLFLSGLTPSDKNLACAVCTEYGEITPADSSNPTFNRELSFTREHYTMLVPENAVEKMNEVL